MLGIYLFLSGERGMRVASSLLESGYKIEKIFTPKDNIVNRDHNLTKVFNYENILNISKVTLKNLNSFIDVKAKLFIVAGFPYIFPKDVINLPEFGTINLHSGRVGFPWFILHSINLRIYFIFP